MLTLKALPAFEDNYIWTLADAEGNAVVVDPGDAAPVMKAAIAGLKPAAVLLTHHHGDHIGGAVELLRDFGIPCYAPDDARIGFACRRVGEGDRLRVAALAVEFDVIAVPGHTLSHIAFVGHGHLFCGDTLFSLGCGRLFEGSPAQMLASLDRLAALPADTLVCCGHEYTESNGRFAQIAEPENSARDLRLADTIRLRAERRPSLPSTIGSERACNPFLRVDHDNIRRNLAARGMPAVDRIHAFAALREWKDGFRA